MLQETERILSPEGLRVGDARIAIACTLALTLALYISSFRIEVSLLIIAIACMYAGLRALRAVIVASPFLAFFALSSFLLRGDATHAATTTFGFASLVALGSVLAAIPPAELSCALVYFRVPYRFAFLISLAVRMFRVYVRDLKQAMEAMKLSGERKITIYAKLLKTMASIAVLRSVAIAETLYSRGFSGKAECFSRRLSRSDCLVLLFAIVVLTYACLY
ncbi:energy-coupling factor transporter transmembrane component T [Archaeoglobus veneficus]|nr:energy-coupling factor transporter transmembrane component T [Archaeoglobus veneficus]